MYGLPQASKLTNIQLQAFLAPHGYHPYPITPGSWTHMSHNIHFTLVIDDFAVRYMDCVDADHLPTHQVTEDWEASQYCSLSITWDYAKCTVDLAMPRYIKHALKEFQHPHPKCPEHAPYAWIKPAYGAATQVTPTPDQTPAMDAADCQCIQEVIGVLPYYTRAVDPTLLLALGTLATQQSQGTQATMEALMQLLNNCTTHPDASIHYHTSNMVLWVHSNASYLSAPKGQSHAAGYYFLSSQQHSTPMATDPVPPDNGPIHVLCQIMQQVVASAAKAELGALFLNAQTACPICTAWDEMRHSQLATPLQTDNSMACGMINDTIKQKCSISINIHFYWIHN